MSRLLVHVEGETEETFVREVLAPYLRPLGYSVISARKMGNARQRSRRYGICAWQTARTEILNHLRTDAECVATTMVDYYALPQTGPDAWPGRTEASHLPFARKAAQIETALKADICSELGDRYDCTRFIPFVMMHEFESILFSDCVRFGEGIGRSDLTPQLQEIRNSFNTPEEINDSPLTAPSKRILALLPGYEKPLMGTPGALHIGIAAIRAECPHFAEWLNQLEGLGRSQT